MPISYVAWSVLTGAQDGTAANRGPGFLRLDKYGGASFASCADGTSNTVALIECVGGNRSFNGGFSAQYPTQRVGIWADPNVGNGVNGPPGGQIVPVNNNMTPAGGPAACSTASIPATRSW